jgi:phage shock protein A
MTKLAAIVAVSGIACAADTRNLERKVDQVAAELQATQRELAELRRRMDRLAAPPERADASRVINGRYAVGAQPTERFVPLIDEELARATERIAAGTPRAKYYQIWVVDKGLPGLERP